MTGATSVPFCSGYFGDRVPVFVQAGLEKNPYLIRSKVAGMSSAYCHAQLFLLRVS
jgi:hypothetical protein